MSYPEKLITYLEQEVLKNARYLMMIVDRQGRVAKLDCPGIQWSLDGLSTGLQIPEVLQAIIDVCDDSEHPQLFPFINLSNDLIADIHVLNHGSGRHIILQDVSMGHEGAHRFQQKAYEVSLLLEREAELSRLLDEKRAEAEQASQAKSRFIAMMSHEFKSPISSIMAHADTLHAERPDAREPAAIQRASWYLLTLVENLLEQAKTDEDGPTLNISSIEVPSLLSDMHELFGIQASSRGLALEVNCSADARLVQADDLRLRQVLVNLLSNAFRYTRKGTISLTCQRRGDLVDFHISDTGSGIHENDIERVFQPFTRVNPGGEGGAGLGLTISRQLVSAMHGEISVTSQPGKGSTFSFSLPVPEEGQQETTVSLEGISVLLVEDDVDIREMYCIWLEDWGVKVRALSGCAEAIAAFKSEPTDLVVTDLFLEDGNGVELLTAVREIEPRVSTVMCSGSDAIEAYFSGDRSLMDSFLSKPVTANRLQQSLQAAIRTAKNT